MRERILWAFFAAAILCACGRPARIETASPPIAPDRGSISVVPQPRSFQLLAQRDFVWLRRAHIEASNSQERAAASFLIADLKAKGIRAEIARGGEVRIHLLARRERRLGSEGYELFVGSRRVTVFANAAPGLFYGIQTLEQLTAPQENTVRTRAVMIADWPAYRWRGIHLDVSRHFFGVADIERYLEVAAHYKLNTFHWHLTDDQAWRVAIAGYPRLTGHGAFYSPKQIRDVVRFAAARAITVVPEIEVPGHSAAARRAYPQSRRFFQDVLGRVMQLFPGPFIHLGGDEVAYSPERVRLMQQAVQVVEARGRRAVVWDDALAARLPKSVIVMAWRGRTAAVRAMTSGHLAIASPDGPLYFDAVQGQFRQEPPATAHMATLEQVYDYAPPGGVLGVQANVWTEKIRTFQQLAYMTLPRELALAEIAWEPSGKKDWNSFMRRLPSQLAWLDGHDYPFRVPNTLFSVEGARVKFLPVPGNPQAAIAVTAAPWVEVLMTSAVRTAVIHYTIGAHVVRTLKTNHGSVRVGLRRGERIEFYSSAVLPDSRRSGETSLILMRIPATAFLKVRRYSRSWSSLVSP